MPKAKKASETRVYVSDVHMCAGRSFAKNYKGHVYDWLGPKEAQNFADFLSYLNKSASVKEVIMLGDMMDNWVCPVDEPPPTFEEIVKARHNKPIVDNLNALCSNKSKRVVYMPGNHDMGVTEKFLNDNFSGIAFGGSAANRSVYRTSRLLAEHGSAHAMFNAPDPVNDVGTRLPLGYYISRVVATKAKRTGDAERHVWTYIDDLLELLGPQKLAASVFEAVLEEAGLSDDTDIDMSTYPSKPDKVKACEIKTKYADLYDQWKKHYGPGMAFKAVMAEIGYLGDLADNLSKKGGTNIIIFGHSHDFELDKDSWFVDDRIYANCGSWCDDKKPSTFVETEKDVTNRKYHVRVKEWKDGAVKLLKEDHVKL